MVQNKKSLKIRNFFLSSNYVVLAKKEISWKDFSISIEKLVKKAS